MIQQGIFVGRGVAIQQIVRQVNEALEQRLRGGISDEAATLARQGVLQQIESIHGELTDIDLTTELSELFNAFSELANDPNDFSLRTLVTRKAESLSQFIRNLRSELVNLRSQTDTDIDDAAKAADDLLTRIEELNQQIVKAENGSGGAHALRDQRDILLQELSQYVDISIVEQGNGAVDVFVGSMPIILNGKSRGLELQRETIDGQLSISLEVKADGTRVQATSGRLGALVASRDTDVTAALDFLDSFANNLIYEVNRIHSQGQGVSGFDSVTGATRVTDATAALNDVAAGIGFTPDHGSFQIHVTQKSTGQRVSSQIAVDLDGINAATDTTLTSLTASIDAVANLSATITADGRLRITADANDFEISFSDDSSGVLAALGINTFFTGSGAGDIGVNPTVTANPGKVAAATEHVQGDNRAALALANLRNAALDALGGLSLTETWNRHIADFAVRLGQTSEAAEADTLVRESLEAQQQSFSGVNSDEEAVNLLSYQRAYQGSARFLTVVDELFQTLLGLL